MVATHILPLLSSAISFIISLEMELSAAGRNTLNECPLYLFNPLRVPIHINPFLSLWKQVTLLSESPFSVLRFFVLKYNCALLLQGSNSSSMKMICINFEEANSKYLISFITASVLISPHRYTTNVCVFLKRQITQLWVNKRTFYIARGQ